MNHYGRHPADQRQLAEDIKDFGDPRPVEAILAELRDDGPDPGELERRWKVQDAALRLRDHADARFGFKYVDDFVDEDFAFTAFALGGAAAAVLGIETPHVKFFVPCDPAEADFTYRHSLAGLTADGERLKSGALSVPVIRIRADLPMGRAVDTIAHECRHVWQRDSGLNMENTKSVEADADAFGEWLYEQFGLYPFADLRAGGKRPAKTDWIRMGSIPSHFWWDVPAGKIYRATEDHCRPRWEFHRYLNLEG